MILIAPCIIIVECSSTGIHCEEFKIFSLDILSLFSLDMGYDGYNEIRIVV
jgi:hypothetical protein